MQAVVSNNRTSAWFVLLAANTFRTFENNHLVDRRVRIILVSANSENPRTAGLKDQWPQWREGLSYRNRQVFGSDFYMVYCAQR